MKNLYGTWWYKYLLNPVMGLFGAIKFNFLFTLFKKKYYSLTEDDLNLLRQKLKQHYYVILNHRKSHLTTYLIGFGNLIKTGKWSYYCHAFMNVDDGTAEGDEGYKFIEATAEGVHFSTFMQVFDCDGVVLLRPKGMTDQEYTDLMDKYIATTAEQQIGKAYDDLFDLMDDNFQSCVETVRKCLMSMPDYEKRFPNFEATIKKFGNLTPQMYYDCPDFEVAFEVKK